MLWNHRFLYAAAIVPAAAACAVLAACNSNGLSSLPSPGAAQTAIAQPQAANSHVAGPNLYVGDSGSVTVYAAGSTTPVRTITQGIFNASALAFDPSGNLYVLNVDLTSTNGAVTVYAAGTNKLLRTITDGLNDPKAIAMTKSGNLLVANKYSVTVYAPGSTKPLRTINEGVVFPVALALGSSGTLYVLNAGADSPASVSVYAPGGSKPTKTLSNGIYSPATMLLSGKLYVGNGDPYTNAGKCCSVAVFPPFHKPLLKSITKDVKYPRALASDGKGNLYVANCLSCASGSAQDSVTVYAPGKNTVLRTITSGVRGPDALAFDASGRLYVANGSSYGSDGFRVTIYAAGRAGDPILTIKTKYRPRSLAFGP